MGLREDIAAAMRAQQQQGAAHTQSSGQMDPGHAAYLAAKETPVKGVPLEAPMLAPDDLIGTGLLSKAGMTVAALMGGIKSAGKKALVREAPLKFDPASPQALIPGVPPVSATELRNNLGDRISDLYRNMSFEADRAHYTYSPTSDNSPSWRIRPETGDQLSHVYTPGGTTNLRGTFGENVKPYPDMVAFTRDRSAWALHPQIPTMSDDALSSVFGGAEGRQKALARIEALRNKQQRYAELAPLVAKEDAVETENLIRSLQQSRSSAASPSEVYDIESQLLNAKRDVPVITSTGAWLPARTDRVGVNTPELMTFRRDTDPARHTYYLNDVPLGSENDYDRLLSATQRIAEQQRRVADAVRDKKAFNIGYEGATPRGIEPPVWAQNLTELPSSRSPGTFADRAWWNQQLGVKEALPYTGDPDAIDRNVIETFYHAMRDNPAAFQYGPRAEHQGAQSLEDLAESFGRASGERIKVTRSGGEPDYDAEPEFEYLTHGRHEKMRDEYGDIKKEPKTHSAGDYPMYDEYGEKKTVELAGVKPTGEPLLPVPRKAQGGEPMNDEWGGQKYEYQLSRGGEIKRDRHGDPIIDEDSFVYPERDGDEIALSVPGKGTINITGYGENAAPMFVEAMGGGKGKGSGELLYQVLLSDALRSGQDVGGTNLTDINKLRMLANTNSNYARWGSNPRELRGTLNSAMTPQMRDNLSTNWYNEISGPDIWNAETATVKHRLGENKDRVLFDGERFLMDGQPAHPDDIKTNLKELSPNVGSTGVGQKSIMRAAVFDWLRGASVEDAERVGKNWGRIGAPLFGNATPEFLAAVAATSAGGAALAKVLQGQSEPSENKP